MATFFLDYQQQVWQVYQQKRDNNTLPHGLMYLTPAKLKEECVKRCTKDVDRWDEKVVRDFCGDLNESKNCHALIKKCDTDKFRPLVNYLKKKSDKTDEKNIELLAWLIEFPGRPWEKWKKEAHDDSIIIGTQEDEESGEAPVIVLDPQVNSSAQSSMPDGNPAIPENPVMLTGMAVARGAGSVEVESLEHSQNQVQRKPAKMLVAVMLSLALGTGGMWWWKDMHQPSGAGGCMYWLEDHYEPIACDQKLPHTKVIALDSMRLKYFRKITRPDTITYQSIGKVWYSKMNGNLEFYTWEGEHPVAFGRWLKPITPYIIREHILQR
ncbi:MAG: hypothetical protein J7623_06620 [Chitinophaga sp.]|uniref:hypothetical protein n=1 Tax=Chitinophaga sp. TaxID=1869181 RepID=UPI001B1757C9|nr:hypothetical protein [Chitinophaga sp.]MBO9728296.1 hypothetical protein [Chitinophaga sp.]